MALVTGASKGIGAACAERLAVDGFDVAVTYARDRAGAEAVVAAIEGRGRRALALQLEARDSDGAAAAVEAAEEGLGPLEALVANAGVTADGPALRMDAATWRTPIDVNLTGTFAIIQAALRGMMRRRSGSVVALSSVVGLQGNVGQANYAASKAGIVGMVRSLAREVGRRGVRVNAVAPGFITTRLTDVLADTQRERLLEATALARLGTPEDVAGAVAFLCSERAAFITGGVISVDGGLRI